MKSIEWVATIETERGQAMLGIQKNSKGQFEWMGKHENGVIEKTGQTDETREIALESIEMLYGGDPWFLTWIN